MVKYWQEPSAGVHASKFVFRNSVTEFATCYPVVTILLLLLFNQQVGYLYALYLLHPAANRSEPSSNCIMLSSDCVSESFSDDLFLGTGGRL